MADHLLEALPLGVFVVAAGRIVAANARFCALLGQTLKLDHEPWWRKATLTPYAETIGTWLGHYAGETRDYARHALDADNGRN